MNVNMTKIEEKVDGLDRDVGALIKMTEQLSEGLNKVSDAITHIATLTERMSSFDDRLRENNKRHEDTLKSIEKRHEQDFRDLREKVEGNSKQIIYWSGGLAALIFAFGAAIAVFKLL